jgi:hypothetical protein
MFDVSSTSILSSKQANLLSSMYMLIGIHVLLPKKN